MKIVKSILENNPCYKAGRKINVKGLMLHSVGCPQPSASVFVKLWNSSDYNAACVHGFIDANDGTVYQTLPWDHRGWHGGGDTNNTHIGVEMCEPNCIKYTGGSTFTCSDTEKAKTMVKRTYEAAVELFAYLCNEYHLDPLADGVIVSHAEGYKRGIASNHGDPEHLWKGLGMGYTMDTFRQAVKAAMGGDNSNGESVSPTAENVVYRVQVGAYSQKANAEAMLAKLKKAGFDGFIATAKAPTPEIKIGSTVRVKAGSKDYTGGTLASFVYDWNHTVKSINGDRVVITHNGVIIAAVHKDNLILL